MKTYLMKTLPLCLVLFSILSLTSCDDSTDYQETPSSLIQQIKNSDLTKINFSSLPPTSQSTIQNNYIPNGEVPVQSYTSPSLGFMVNLIGQGGTSEAFFDVNGVQLIAEEEGDDPVCWEYIYPVMYIASDSTSFVIASANDYGLLENWVVSNPTLVPDFSLVFPITIKDGDGLMTNIQSSEDLYLWEAENCSEGEHNDNDSEGDGEG